MAKKEQTTAAEITEIEPKIEKSLQEENPKFRSHLHEGYWFDVGKKLIDDSEANLNHSAEKFEKLILWFWSVYTSIVGLGAGGFTVFLGKSISVGTLVGLILPSVILLIAYWLTTAAGSSAVVEFEHRSPDSIREAFMEGIKTKARFFYLARLFAFLACIAIPLTIFLANRVQSGDFEVLRVSPAGENFDISISGIVPKGSKYELNFFMTNKTFTRKGETDTGHFAEDITISSGNKTVNVKLWWSESEGKGSSREKTFELKEK